MRNVVQLCLAANVILLTRKWNHVFSLLRSPLRENGGQRPEDIYQKTNTATKW